MEDYQKKETEEKYCTIYILRHGETEHNVNEIIQGQADSPLTQKGESQAKGMAQELKDMHFDVVFSSDLGRANRTAEIIKLERELAVNTSKLIRERSFGVYEGRTAKDYYAENQAMLEKLQTLSEKDKHSFRLYPSQETNEEISSRMMTFLREIAAAYPGKTVLAVSHGSIMRALLVALGVASYDQIPGSAIENLGYIVLKSDGVDFFVSGLKRINIKGLLLNGLFDAK